MIRSFRCKGTEAFFAGSCAYGRLTITMVLNSRCRSAAVRRENKGSDWDIAVQWDFRPPWLDVLARTEILRRNLAQALGLAPETIDLIELRRAHLAMRTEAAEAGIFLKSEDTLAWARCLTRTWR